MKFRLELEVDYDKFSIPDGQYKSMVNAMQRQQAQWAVEDALKMAGMNPTVLGIYKARA